MECLSDTSHNVAVSKESAKRKWRTRRDQFTGLFEDEDDSTSYPAVQKVCGDVLVSLFENPQDIGITGCSYSVDPMEISDNSSRDAVFGCGPLLVLPLDEVGDAKTHYHTECADFLENNAAPLKEKAEKGTHLVSTSSGVSVRKGCFDPAAAFAWNIPARTAFFSSTLTVKVPVFVQEVGKVWVGEQDRPYCGIPCMLHAVRGAMVVILIRPTTLLEHPNIHSWLKGLSSTGLAKTPTVLLRQGSSLHVPFCWFPIIVGVPSASLNAYKDGKPDLKTPERKSTDPKECVTYAFNMRMDPSAHNHDIQQQIRVASLGVEQYSHRFKYFKETQTVLDWYAKLSKAQAHNDTE
jgi:hypothetical protein